MGNTACILETVPASEVILLPENLWFHVSFVIIIWK